MSASSPGLIEPAEAPYAMARDRLSDVRLVEHAASDRAAIEDFIARRFRDAYGAELRHFMPRLFGLYDGNGELVAAFGLRAARGVRLFLEQYLDEPVEALVARHFGVDAAREDVVEIGNLAGATQGALRRLIPVLTEHLHVQGHRWIAFTGAAHLCNGFTRLGLPLQIVAPAQMDRLPESERGVWGCYYDRHPSVMLGDVELGHRTLDRLAHSPAALNTRLAPIARVGAP